jgi:hypothetical protein
MDAGSRAFSSRSVDVLPRRPHTCRPSPMAGQESTSDMRCQYISRDANLIIAILYTVAGRRLGLPNSDCPGFQYEARTRLDSPIKGIAEQFMSNLVWLPRIGAQMICRSCLAGLWSLHPLIVRLLTSPSVSCDSSACCSGRHSSIYPHSGPQPGLSLLPCGHGR